MYLGGLLSSTGRRTPIRASEGLPRNSLKIGDLVAGRLGLGARGTGEGDRPGDDLAVEGGLVGRGDAAGDRLEAGHVALDPAGDDLDAVDDLARAGGRRRFRGLAEDDDAGGRRVGAPGPGDERQPGEQAGEARRRRPLAPGWRRFSAVCKHDLHLEPRCSYRGCGRDSAFAARRNAPCLPALHDPGQAASVGLRSEMGAGGPGRRFHRRRPGVARNRGGRDRARGDRRRPPALLARHPRAALARPRRARARARPGPLERRRERVERARPDPARAGGGDRLRRGRRGRAARRGLARIEERNPAINAVVETFPERSREMLDGRPDGPAARRPGRDQGRVAAALAGAALRRRRNAGPDRARRVRPLPRPARRRGGDRRGRQHARGRRQQHGQRLRLRPRPQPLEHRALPRRLLERPRRRGRRAARRRRRRRRRDRLDPLPGRLLRPDRAEADLRPLGDGRATTWRP